MQQQIKAVLTTLLIILATCSQALATPPPSQWSGSHDEMYIFDPAVKDASILEQGLTQGAAIVRLRSGEDGVRQIAAAVEGKNVKTLHLISHGSPGRLYLGNTVVSQEQLARYAKELATIRKSIGGGEFLLYGCNVAEGIAGQAFVSELAGTTGATVAASTDPTGATTAGGNGVLEFSTGNMTSEVLASIDRYPHTLVTYTFDTNSQGWTAGPSDEMIWYAGFGGPAIISGTARSEVNFYPPTPGFVTTLQVHSYMSSGQNFHMYVMYGGVVKYSAEITTSTTWVTHTINQNFDRIRFVNDIGGGNGWFYPGLDNVVGATPAPNVNSVSPASGPTGGGTSVTITGTDFTGATAVKFGSTNASSFTVNSATRITATAPAGTGTVHITVTTSNGTNGTGSGDQFTYVGMPTVTGISPNSGPSSGGTSVTITGTNLTNATAVKFGSTAAASYTVDSATQITATSPAGSAGTVDITVTTAGGTSATSAADRFTFVALPTVTTIAPPGGPLSGGTSVVITGTAFSTTSSVMFGSTPASAFTVNSATQITATAPAGTAGTVDVTVSTVGGTSATGAADRFTYYQTPAILGITPGSGPATGGTVVTITGTTFSGVSGAAGVRFGTTNAASYTVDSTTQITATAPAGSAGTAHITVTGYGGTSAVSALDQFTYVPPPTVTGVSPTGGPTTGGTTVTLTGTNFTGATAVRFGSTNAAFSVNSATQIVATAPAGSAGAVHVTVTTLGGTSATGASDMFTYLPPPTVTAVTPASGPTSGGTTVTLTGTNFTGASAVTFGSIAATGFTVNSATRITATAPAGAAGIVDITVTNQGVTSETSATDGFTYVAATVPTVTGVSPATGTTAGGTSVTITGTDFTAATEVRFGGTAAAYMVNSPTRIVAFSPPGSSGAVDITVTTAGGTSTTGFADQFTYNVPPAVTGIAPRSGPTAGETVVTITGINFSGASAVTFGSTPATSFTVVSDTEITATSPALAAGVVDVQVTAASGTSAASAADVFTYVTPAVATIVIDPVTPATLYAGLDGAGVYRSSNSGANWSPATVQPGNLRIKALAMKDAAHLFAAGYGGGIFTSSDSGDHWNACANTNLTNLNIVSLTSDGSGKLYAGTENGVFVSSDDCATWTAMSGGLP